MSDQPSYRGRLAPSPTGFLHRGHAATFWRAQTRCRERGGQFVLRIEDLDRERCKPEYRASLLQDMRWYGLAWDEGPDVGGNFASYTQSERMACYEQAWRRLAALGVIYPCTCTRRDVEIAVGAPHPDEYEAIYPGTCRPDRPVPFETGARAGVNWRFRTSPTEVVTFDDAAAGPQRFVVGKDFGDFVVWRRDSVPAYQLAVVTDDAAMGITEVVRGEDLLPSTAQQILIYRALGWRVPAFFHCPLVLDAAGQRLAKRTGAHSLRALREAGVDPASLRPAADR